MNSLIDRRVRTVAATLAALGAAAPALAQDTPPNRNGIETVLVTERALQRDAALTPGGITLVDGDGLRERNVSSLADLLRYVPGMWSASASGNDEVFLSSRGSNLDSTDYDGNGVLLLQDGLPVTTADGNNHNRVLDPLSARYASVARGANALQYGASTLGGAIDFTSPTARDGAMDRVFANMGSHGQQLARVTAGNVFGDRLDGLLTLEGKQWDGYREHNEQSRKGFYANVGWEPSADVTSRWFATYLENDQQLPGSLSRAEVDADPSRASAQAVGGDYQLDVDTLRLANKTTWQLAQGRSLELGASYERQQLFHPIVDKVLVDFDGPGPAAPVEVFSLLVDTAQRNVGAVVRYRETFGAHNLLLGLGYADSNVQGGNYRNDGGRRNGLTERVDNAATTTSLYGLDRWDLGERWLVELAAQGVAAARSVATTPVATNVRRNPHRNYSHVTPRFGAIYELAGDAELFANLSGLYEPPTNYQLDDDVRGNNAALAAMHGTAVEVGARGHGARGMQNWNWDVTAYYAEIRDEILSIDDPSAPGTSLATNVRATVHAGIEAALGADFTLAANGGAIAPLLSIAVNDFSFDGDPTYGDRRLPAAPRYAVKAEVLYRTTSGFYVGPTFDLAGERFADFANTYRVASYSLLGIRLGINRARWRAYAELRNVRDEEYVATHGVRDLAAPDAAILNPGEPASAYVGFDAQF